MFLCEIADGGVRRADRNAAAIGSVESRQDAQQRGLADAIGSDDADAGLRADDDVDSDENRREAASLRDAVRRKRGERGR